MEACTQKGQTHKQGHTQPEAWGGVGEWGGGQSGFHKDPAPGRVTWAPREGHLGHFNTSDRVRKRESGSASPGITAVIVASVS